MSVNLHISITVSVQGSKHDAKRTCPVTEQHEQTMTKALLRENTSSLVHCKGHRDGEKFIPISFTSMCISTCLLVNM